MKGLRFLVESEFYKMDARDDRKITVDRRGLFELLSGILAGLGMVGTVSLSTHGAESLSANDDTIDDSYLVQGLTGMARANSWFDAHWGAGILAGYYLCKDNAFGTATTAAIKRQLDAVVQTQPDRFSPFGEQESDESLIEEVPKSLGVALEGGLRAHGHAVIFASLSTRALRDAPHMAKPTIVDALRGLSHKIAKLKPQPSADPQFVYQDSNTMIEATLDSLVRFKSLLGYPSVRRPNFTHMVTHTEALLNLELMGYGDLARLGHAGHRAHISAPVPIISSDGMATYERPTLHTLTQPEFWSDITNQQRWARRWSQNDNPNGDWIASGHLFKVLYSYHRLLGRVPNRADIDLCSSILLERYVNPNVQGG